LTDRQRRKQNERNHGHYCLPLHNCLLVLLGIPSGS
jgi:hypothetical protein